MIQIYAVLSIETQAKREKGNQCKTRQQSRRSPEKFQYFCFQYTYGYISKPNLSNKKCMEKGKITNLLSKMWLYPTQCFIIAIVCDIKGPIMRNEHINRFLHLQARRNGDPPPKKKKKREKGNQPLQRRQRNVTVF